MVAHLHANDGLCSATKLKGRPPTHDFWTRWPLAPLPNQKIALPSRVYKISAVNRSAKNPLIVGIKRTIVFLLRLRFRIDGVRKSSIQAATYHHQNDIEYISKQRTARQPPLWLEWVTYVLRKKIIKMTRGNHMQRHVLTPFASGWHQNDIGYGRPNALWLKCVTCDPCRITRVVSRLMPKVMVESVAVCHMSLVSIWYANATCECLAA